MENENRIREAIEKLQATAIAVPGITVWEYEPQYYTDGSGALRCGNKKSTCAMAVAYLTQAKAIDESVRLSLMNAQQCRSAVALSKVRSRDDYARFLVEFEGESVSEANMMAMRAGRELQSAVKRAKKELNYNVELRKVWIPLYEAILGRDKLASYPAMQRYYSGYYD